MTKGHCMVFMQPYILDTACLEYDFTSGCFSRFIAMALQALASSLINDLVKTHSGPHSGTLIACPEFSWVVSTLLDNGFTRVDLGSSNIETIQEVLQETFNLNTLFELGIEDIAKVMIALSQLGISIQLSQLAERHSDGVLDYKMSLHGRDTSLTTISHTLTAMCISADRLTYTSEIEMATKDLCEAWCRDPSSIGDQRNDSRYYSTLQIISKALKRVLNAWCQQLLPGLNLQFVRDATLVVFQILVRLLKDQENDGSWGGQRDNTAYALITVNELASLSIAEPVMYHIKDAIEKGRNFLSTTLAPRPCPEHLRSYGSTCLSQTLTLAAVKCSITVTPVSIQELLPSDLHTILQSSKFFAQLPILSETPEWCITAWLIEGSLFQQSLGKLCLDTVFKKEKRKQKYLSVIPFTWTASNNMHGCPIGSNTMLEMMAICALAYQVDDFVESEVACLPSSALHMIRMSIQDLFCEVEGEEFNTNVKHEQGHDIYIIGSTQPSTCSNQPIESDVSLQGSPQSSASLEIRLGNIKRDLKNIIRRLWEAPYVRTATHHSRSQLRIALVDYITAHVIQAEESVRLAAQSLEEKGNHKTLVNPPSSLLTWVRTVSGDHTIGPYAVAAFSCMYDHGADPIRNPQASYILQDVARHLAALCRLYNDYGSITRDRDEDNLNSINFPEFQGNVDERVLKENLKSIAEYERRCLHVSMAELQPLITKNLFTALTVLCETAEIYNQMYVLKDLTADFNKQ
ncbi:hypothetical protein F4859DRAFT_483249 [Xylaria cf. heliscus]|nr:hypothetical protein F4859DRAFT_483249 [Xylaria cf. heliscus]